jgi:hypothetical protein
MDPDGRFVDFRTRPPVRIRNRQLRQNCTDNKQQREQHPADKHKISR